MLIEIIIILVLLVACMGLAYEVRRRGEDLERLDQVHRHELEERRQADLHEVEELQERHESTMAQLTDTHQLEIEQLHTLHQRELAGLADQRRAAVAARPSPAEAREDQGKLSRRQWMDGLSKISYRNDVEVDVKFVHPLVRFLGYDPDDFSLQVPLDLPQGRQTRRGQADWVLWRNNHGADDHAARAVIEVLAPTQELDEATREQARALAVGAGAPFYLLTNGRHIQLFRRDVRADQLLIDCPLAEFPECWQQIHDLLGVR